MDDKDYPVRIINPEHPHYNETGVIQSFGGQVTVKTMGGLKLYTVKLDNCPEGMESGMAALYELARRGAPKIRKGAVR